MTNPTNSVSCTRVFAQTRIQLSVLLTLLALFAAGSASAQVLQYYAATYSSTDNWITDAGGMSSTGAHCSATGCDATLNTRFTTLVTPAGRSIIITPHNLLVGSNYTVELCVPTSAGNIGTNINVTWTFTGADDGHGGTPVFDATAYSSGHYKIGAAFHNDVWYMVGQFAATSTDPQITVNYVSSTDATGQRWNEGAYRLSLVGDCRNNVPQLTTVDGPLIAGQTNVTVMGVTNGATTVYVYANAVKVGTNSSFSLGTNTTGSVTVRTSALNKGDLITASQVLNLGGACGSTEGYPPGGGPAVGGGANPQIRMVFEIGKNVALTGPVGANAGAIGSPLYWLGSGARAQATTGASFVNGFTLTPGAGWQTVAFDNASGPTLDYNDNTFGPIAGTFGVLSGIAFAMEDTTDTGPFNIYIDNIKNGTNVLFDAETNNVGSTPFFNTPNGGANFGGYNSAVNVLPDPNLCSISTSNADTGTKAILCAFQFSHNSFNTTWMHVSTKNFPEVDLSKPVSMRVLVLPVGTKTNGLNIISPVYLPNLSKVVGSSASFSVASAVLGGTDSASVSYQWMQNGNNLTDTTTPNGSVISGTQTATLQINNVTSDVQGDITCTITSGTFGYQSSVSGSLTATTSVPPSSLTYSFTGPSTLNLSWTAGVLQSADTLLSAGTVWTDVAGANSPYQVPVTTQKYYRLRGL